MRRAAVWVLHIGACMDASLPGPLRLKEVPVVLNGGSGDGHGRERAKRLEEAFREAGVEPRVWPFGPGGGGRGVARRALGARPPVLVAAGGDGTLSAVADVLRGTDTALGVIPVGTMNHFAKDLGIPLDAGEAAQVIGTDGAFAWTWARSTAGRSSTTRASGSTRTWCESASGSSGGCGGASARRCCGRRSRCWDARAASTCAWRSTAGYRNAARRSCSWATTTMRWKAS